MKTIFQKILILKMTKKIFKFLFVIIFIVIIILGIQYTITINKPNIKECSDKMLIKKIMESLNEQPEKSKIEIMKVFYYNLPETKYFLCGYVVEKIFDDNSKNKFVVFSDKNVNFIFLGDIIDIRSRKIVGYDVIIQNIHSNNTGEQCGK